MPLQISATLPSTNPVPAPENQERAELQNALQHFVTHLVNSRGTGRKRKSTDKDDEDKENEGQSGFRDYGRAFARLGEPFSKVSHIVEHGLTHEAADSDASGAEETSESILMVESWQILCGMIAGFKKEMIAIAAQRKLRRSICKEIHTGVDKARSDDTSSLKSGVLGYLILNTNVALSPPIDPKYPYKVIRGWSHAITAMLLMPLAYEANDTMYAAVKSGDKVITAELWPRFLYPDNQPYNPEDEEEGLFRGHLMLRCAKHLFTGPSSALQPPGFHKGKAGVAKIIGMTKITARVIAYIAVQARFAISDAQEWNEWDRNFHYVKFYWNIVSFFTGGGADVLKFYNQLIFGNDTAQQLSTVRRDIPGVESAVVRMANERAKRARTNAASSSETQV